MNYKFSGDLITNCEIINGFDKKVTMPTQDFNVIFNRQLYDCEVELITLNF